MRKNFHHLIHIESALTRRKNARHSQSRDTRMFTSKRPREIGICRMTGLHCDNMPAQARTEQREIAYDVQNLMANKFVRETQWFLAQNSFAADDDRILQAAAFDQVFLHE